MIDLHILGDIKKVLEGRVNKESLIGVNLFDISYGLGAGFFESQNKQHIGEAIVFENQAYVYVPDQIWTHESFLQTPFLMGIKRKPKNIEIFNQSTTLLELYDSLLKTYTKGYAIVGQVHFSKLEAAYLKRPPIFHEKINENKEKYWHQESRAKILGKIVGIVLPYLNDKAFYHNPNEAKQDTSTYSHTHVLVEDNARHLLTHSTLEKAELWVEEIQ